MRRTTLPAPYSGVGLAVLPRRGKLPFFEICREYIVAPNILPSRTGWRVLALALLVTILAYWPGLYGGWIFDDYPNIVDNHGVQIDETSLPALIQAALSSPASDFKRPLASLSFALNYRVGGLDPFGWKLLNLLVHLLNGIAVYALVKRLLLNVDLGHMAVASDVSVSTSTHRTPNGSMEHGTLPAGPHPDIIAAIVAAAWLLLPINLTAVLYVVQREESLANLFVLTGLIGYVIGRQRMLALTGGRWLLLCIASLVMPVVIGVLAKETAIMLPLYALLIEWIIFRFRTLRPQEVDRRIVALFLITLAIPFATGMVWLWPKLIRPESWAARDFTLETRLLSEARIVCDYIKWVLLPTPGSLSFYHDEFDVSQNLLSPWTTLWSVIFLGTLTGLAYAVRRRRPLIALGVGLYLGSHLLTGTLLPLELVYEHRNYFGSLGLLFVIVPMLARAGTPFAFGRQALLGALLIYWTTLTAYTAVTWGEPLRLAKELADRAHDSPRAQYELGRTYIIYSRYDPASPYTQLAYAPLERAAAMPKSSILPQQALIFMNARMRLPQKEQWWDSMVAKLKARPPGVQDESSLIALTQCARDGSCLLSNQRMNQCFEAAINHNGPSGRLLAAYGDYAWNLGGDHDLGERLIGAAVKASPREPAYRITQIRMLVAQNKYEEARASLEVLQTLNVGGHLDTSIKELRASLSRHYGVAGSAS